MTKTFAYFILTASLLALMFFTNSCKRKKEMVKTQDTTQGEDTVGGRCKMDYKSARTLGRRMKEKELDFNWISAKANVETHADEKDESFDIKLSIRKDSAILVTIQYVLGLQVARALITKDSVHFVDYIHKTYFKGDFNYINNLLNADLDYDVVQAVLLGNSAEFHDEEARLKPAADRVNCRYLLSTERKRRLRKIQGGDAELRNAMQTLTLNSEYKILANEFIDPGTNRKFIASYSNFTQKDSVYAPYHVDIDIMAQKNASLKIDYVRIEKNTPLKIFLNIPAKYDAIQIQKK